MNKQFVKQAGIFILFLIGFWAISAIYLSPAIGGEKVLVQGDMQQVRLMTKEATEYKAQYGEFPGWSDGLFSGMPTSLITGIPSGNIVLKTQMMSLFGLVKSPFSFLFVAMMSMFVLLISSGVNRWLAAAGGIGYAFMTFSITSYEAGHITKVLAMDVVPGMLAGLILFSRKKYLWGSAVLGVFFTMVVGYFHYQIAYYAGIVAVIYLLVEMINGLRSGDKKHTLIAVALSGIFMLVGSLANIGKAVDTMQYSKATMRGGSEVASETPAGGPKQQTNKTGLEKEYAFSWSYGIDESFTILIPKFMGGSSNEPVGENEITGEPGRLPLYYGQMQFTSGPVYIGAVFIFLFILGIVTVWTLYRNESSSGNLPMGIMIFSVATVLISLMLAWGRHFAINDLLFEYLPYYNKFRTPMMAMSITQIIIPFFGLYGLQLLLNAKTNEKVFKDVMKKSAMGIAGLLGLAGIMLLSSDFSGASDKELLKNYGPEFISKLKELRSSEAWGDFFRSFMFILAAAGLVYYTATKENMKTMMWLGLIVLISIDMIGVSKRYLSEENWQDKVAEEEILPSPKDELLMKANTDYSRVYDLRYNPFNDNRSAPWHRNIGGYHPAKLSRYQDIISFGITKNGGQPSYDLIMNNNALDMLNCKYVLSMDQEKKGEEIIPRATALGNAWFVSKIVEAASPKDALEKVNTINVRNEAVMESKDKKPATLNFAKDTTASIVISRYNLDTITYNVKSSTSGFAVFSEIYYNEKNGSWKAYVDGKESEVFRVNYILRGLEIPAGAKEVKFVFDKPNNPWLTVEFAASGLALGLLLTALGLNLFRKTEPEAENA